MAGRTCFIKEGDYAAFLDLMAEANEQLPLRILGYVLISNQFHLVLWPHGDGDLSRWMQWLLTSHVRRYHRHYHGSGHMWQGRFKAFPIEQDDHLRTVLRYAERNPLRANLVRRRRRIGWGFTTR
jgi:putative transposase